MIFFFFRKHFHFICLALRKKERKRKKERNRRLFERNVRTLFLAKFVLLYHCYNCCPNYEIGIPILILLLLLLLLLVCCYYRYSLYHEFKSCYCGFHLLHCVLYFIVSRYLFVLYRIIPIFY
eukprot:Rmarinus@m.29238